MPNLRQAKKHHGHELVRSFLYGPVASRRYGRSLGINILPTNQKVCSFNCVYCQLGWNAQNRNAALFPPTKKIVAELKNRLPTLVSQGLDTIALSGNGEPTLHPDFDKIVTTILSVTKQRRHRPKIICLTNGTGLVHQKIRHVLALLDECCLKVDANHKQINLPQKSFNRPGLLRYAKRLKNLVVQSCFFDGKIGNVDTKSVREWTKIVSQLKPVRVDIYTISRRTPTRGLSAISAKKLRSIVSHLRRCSSVKVRVCP
jgi:wyosine [tRNA(Phe)-imidazoG37] synthetase (radical SAM superfamily)